VGLAVLAEVSTARDVSACTSSTSSARHHVVNEAAVTCNPKADHMLTYTYSVAVLQLLLTAHSPKLLFAHTSQLLHQCSVALTSGLLSGLTCVTATAT